MKKSTKAVLLSGLVFPGLGHLYLKRWVMGVTIAGIAAFALYYLLSITMGIALDVSQRVADGTVPADIASVTVRHQVVGIRSGLWALRQQNDDGTSNRCGSAVAEFCRHGRAISPPARRRRGLLHPDLRGIVGARVPGRGFAGSACTRCAGL